MSSTVAKGGKVWSIPDESEDNAASSAVSFPSTSNKWGLRKVAVVMTALWATVTAAFYVLAVQSVEYEIIQHATFGKEFGIEIIDHSKSHYIFFGIMVLVLGALLTAVIGSKTDYDGGALLVSLVCMVSCMGAMAVLITSGILPAADQRPKVFEEWAKATYGYTSIEKVENDKDVYDVVKANGEQSQAKAYIDGKYTYLYETPEQLRDVLDQIDEKKAALSK